jgi:predicted acetyltransferase
MAAWSVSSAPLIGLKLETPSVAFRDSYLQGLAEFQSEGLPWFMEMDYGLIENDFEGYVDSVLAKAYRKAGPIVQETELWGVVNGTFVGKIAIRHELNDALRIVGGNIGYDTVPRFRRKGYASDMLRLALPKAKSLGLSKALITCDDTNVASIKIIEKNGGKLSETKSIDPGKPMKRYYWIDL